MKFVQEFPLLIVVPTLNSSELLPNLLHSLQRQSWTNWRLLFIDGPSVPSHRAWLNRCCANDPRCSWVEQAADHHGIFGAMNQGFSLATSDEWLLFWGSDDWAATPNSLEAVIRSIELSDRLFDLIVCQGRYADASTAVLGRTTKFQPEGVLNSDKYRRALLFGSSPPHQATLFGPGARAKLNHYAPGFRLSADLDYFLQLSRHSDLCVFCLDLELVHMADGGVSGQQTQRRLQEVRLAYCRAYGWRWWFPLLIRYARRVLSLALVLR